MNIDIHNNGDRDLVVKMPKWYSYTNIKLVDSTILGSSAYAIKLMGNVQKCSVVTMYLDCSFFSNFRNG